MDSLVAASRNIQRALDAAAFVAPAARAAWGARPAMLRARRRNGAGAHRFSRRRGKNSGSLIKTTETKIYKVDYLIQGVSATIGSSLNNGSFSNNIEMASSTTVDNIYYFGFSPANLPTSTLLNLFDQCKIAAITFRVIPRVSESVDTGTTVVADTANYIYTSLDYDGSSGTTVKQMTQEVATREHNALRPIVRHFVPKALAPILNGQLNVNNGVGYSIPSPWFNNVGSTNNIVWGISVGIPVQTQVRKWDFQVTLHMMFKERIA